VLLKRSSLTFFRTLAGKSAMSLTHHAPLAPMPRTTCWVVEEIEAARAVFITSAAAQIVRENPDEKGPDIACIRR
jgi:hypothetical protein